MKQEELTKTFMTISNWKKPILVHMVYTKKNLSFHTYISRIDFICQIKYL